MSAEKEYQTELLFDEEYYTKAAEAAMFAYGSPISFEKLAEAIGAKVSDIPKILNAMIPRYKNSAIEVLILGGAMLLWLTEPISFLAALFQSITPRTAGFSTIDIGAMTNAGLLVIMILMFIGASPGSTGGGIKTTTFFVLMQEVRSIFSKRRLGAFRRRLPEESLTKAATITLLGTIVVFVGTFVLCVLEPQHSFVQLLFEQISAYSTAGLTMGITPSLHAASKVVLIATMFIGRVGAFTLLSLWVSRPEPSAKYTEEAITIG